MGMRKVEHGGLAGRWDAGRGGKPDGERHSAECDEIDTDVVAAERGIHNLAADPAACNRVSAGLGEHDPFRADREQGFRAGREGVGHDAGQPGAIGCDGGVTGVAGGTRDEIVLADEPGDEGIAGFVLQFPR
jgi:hypothetical protein